MSVPQIIKSSLPPAAMPIGEVSINTTATPVKPAGGSSVIGSSSTPNRGRSAQQSGVTSIPAPSGTQLNVNAEKNENSNSGSITATPATSIKGRPMPKTVDEFYKDLHQFHERRATPITHMPKISGRILDLHRLYTEVTERGGFQKVNARDEWDEVLPMLNFQDKCVNASAAVKHIYRRFLEKYERLTFFGEDPDKIDAMEASEQMETIGRSRSRYPALLHHSSSANSHGSGNANALINTVPMSYNYRQHIVNMDRRRMFKLATDLHKHSPYEKLMLSLLSPLPNEQDFAVNACTLMANESKHTLKLNEYPKLLDVLLAHTGVYPDYSMRKLFQHIYTDVRRHSMYSFWRDLLYDKPQILDLHTDEQSLRQSGLIDKLDDDIEMSKLRMDDTLEDFLSMDFLNLNRGEGTQDYVGQRVQQILVILRNLSFFDENLQVFAKNRTFWRFLVMCGNVRWGTIHNQALDIAGNIATELDLLDPTLDELSRCLMATLCDGIEGSDRGVIINCMEILYKLCQKDSNEDYIHKCLNLKFYQTVCLFLSLKDIMLLIFTLEAIYALTSMGARSCHLIMQVRGVIDQLVSLITVEVQSYAPDGCISMRVVETVPGNMLPLVAQNIANLQNAAVIQKQQHQQVVQQHNVLPVQVPQQQYLPTQHLDQQTQQQQQQLQVPNEALTSNTTTVATTAQQAVPQTQLHMPQNYSQEDEQYALAWLGATFERATSAESNVEQQELYRMYLSHCQKSGKHSVVNHLHFPRLVRLIFNHTVGPVIVRRSDGTELPGFHYVAIRVRAQPLPIQSKGSQSQPKVADNKFKNDLNINSCTLASARKIKKKFKPQTEQLPQLLPSLPTQPIQQIATTDVATATSVSTVTGTTAANMAKQESATSLIASTTNTTNSTKTSIIQEQSKLTSSSIVASDVIKSDFSNASSNVSNASVTTQKSFIIEDNTTVADVKLLKTDEQQAKITSVTGAQVISSASVQQHQQQQIITTTVENPNTTLCNPQIHQQQQLYQQQTQQQIQQGQPTSSLIKSLLANKVTQRQLKQKELTTTTAMQTTTQTSVLATTSTIATHQQQQQQQQQQQPIKVASTAISALVNNPLMQNASVKVGQTTIKPLNPQTQHDKKTTSIIESSAPPPLAPLSGNNVAKDASGRPVLIANQMLVEILDKKAVEPPIPATIIKRKFEDVSNIGTESAKRLALETVVKDDMPQVAPSKNAANLYAEMAASILEDEELDDIPPISGTQTATSSQPPQLQVASITEQIPQSTLIIPAKMQQQTSSIQTNIPRQLVFQAPQTPQLKLTQAGPGAQQLPTAMATIKTDQGLQTVPVILQQKTLDQTQQSSQIIQQVLQQQNVVQQQQQQQPQQQTQYVLATNQQGQTYLVAQQPPPQPPPQPTQTVLVTQTPQQQSAGTKTIIILQQQALPTGVQNQVPQQQIITTATGQQVLVTQRAAPQMSHQTPQQIIINPQTGTATHIQHMPVNTSAANLLQRQILQQQPQQQQQTGQISPSLLSQLNHIPATIKLHQPSQLHQQQMHQQQLQLQQTAHHQPATISRISKSVAILPTPPSVMTTTVAASVPPPPIQIPQLQQHQSIIQQHLISGPAEKRQVILGTGRAIEIKETVITQTQPQLQAQPQQSQLNSQTIITKQPTPQQPQLQQLQQQQQIRAVIEQQQQQHPSIIQQKISVPLQQTLITQKVAEKQLQQQQHSNIIQATLPAVTQPPSLVQTISTHQPTTSSTPATTTIKKPIVQVATSTVKSAVTTAAAVVTQQMILPKITATVTNANTTATEPPPLAAVMPNINTTTAATTAAVTSAATASFASTVSAAYMNQNKQIQQQQKPQELPKDHRMDIDIESKISANIVTSSMATSASQVLASSSSVTTTATAAPQTHLPMPQTQQPSLQSQPQQQQQQQIQPLVTAADANWLYICDWRNCPRRKYKSLNDLQHHACQLHSPDHLEAGAEIFCQWGVGPNLCDGIPRKRYSLMTHLIDRHLTPESLRAAMQRRISTGTHNIQPTQPPVTIVRNMDQSQRNSTASPALSTSSSSSLPSTGTSAIHAIKRHTADFVNPKELMDENEGPVTKSIRLTAALILRNLVTYTTTAKRNLRRYEPHLANVALSNVESSGAISHILFELNN